MDKIESALTWDEYYLNLAFSASLRSKDPSTKVGAVLVKGSTVAIGYNGFPIGIADLETRWRRPAKYKFVVHSEANALSNAQFDVRGATLYISHNQPCNECAKLIVQHGVARVVCSTLLTSPVTQAHSDESLNMLREAGVVVDVIEFEQIYNNVKTIMSKAHGLS